MKKLVRPKKKQFGQYFTPSFIAKFIVENTVGEGIKQHNESYIETATILDPSVGEGVFLVEALKFLVEYCASARSNDVLHDIKKKIIADQLFGFDIDEEQVITARSNLGYSNFFINIKKINALLPYMESSYSKHQSDLCSTRISYKKKFINNKIHDEKELREEIVKVEKKAFVKPLSRESNGSHAEKGVLHWNSFFPEIKGKFNVIIGNPPWGVELTEIQNYIELYNSATAQVDSWVLFLEQSVNSLKIGGFLGFVVPNTLLQNPNYKDIRKLILDTCQITHLVNLGEGIFPEVSQPSMLIIAKKTRFDPDFMVNVVPKISKHQMVRLKEGTISIGDCENYYCSQNRFINNPLFQYDIWAVPHSSLLDIIDGDMYTDKETTVSFRTLVTNSRGVEIGRKGLVVKCAACSYYSSPPKKKKKCSNPKCQNQLYPELEQIKIISSSPSDGRMDQPFFAGYQVHRYYTLTPLFIDPQCNGINYKSPTLYVGPKLLVRKTGSQMNWVIDYSDTWVSQVVYIFKLREEALKKYSTISLEYLLGILSSDLMNFYIHSKFYEKDRKDFPHLIQSSLLELPIRIPQIVEEENIIKNIEGYVSELQKAYQK